MLQHFTNMDVYKDKIYIYDQHLIFMFMHAARLTTWFTIKMHIFSLDREEIPVERQSLEILLPLFSRQIFP